jgi:hypothetical protein
MNKLTGTRITHFERNFIFIHLLDELSSDGQYRRLRLHKQNLIRSTARHAIHLQFDISSNALKLRAVQC